MAQAAQPTIVEIDHASGKTSPRKPLGGAEKI
jgi:hypothetical protein